MSINFPTFFVNQENTARKYVKVNAYFLAGATDFKNPLIAKADEGLSIFFSGLSPVEKQTAHLVNGSILDSPIYQEYFSMVPSRLGPPGSKRAVKYF